VSTLRGGAGDAVEREVIVLSGTELRQRLAPGDVVAAVGPAWRPSACRFEVPAEALDVRVPHGEQSQIAAVAPGGELPQVPRVGLAGQVAAFRPGTRLSRAFPAQ
jgi:hypothetical protein